MIIKMRCEIYHLCITTVYNDYAINDAHIVSANWCRDPERSYYGKVEKIIVPAVVFLTLLLAGAFITKMTIKGKLTHMLPWATRKHFEVVVGNGEKKHYDDI